MPAQNLVIYVRRSQDRDERQAQSIEDQLRHARSLADRLGLRVLHEMEESRSAKEPNMRPEFERILQMADRGEIDGIIAWHPDRLSRNEIDGAAVTYRLRKGALKDLHFVTYSFSNTPEGIMMLQMALSQSQYQVSKLAVDVWRGMETKIQHGWAPFFVPPGWINDRNSHTNVKDPERFGLLRRFVDLVLSGAYPVSQALRILNEEWGFRTRQTEKQGGRQFSRTAAYDFLSNPFLAGYFVWKGTTYQGSHEPMVTLQEFEHLRNVIQGHRRRQRKHDFPFTGLITCGRCEGAITASLQTGKGKKGRYVYYHCSNSRGHCDRHGIREEVLEAQIDRKLKEITIDSDMYQHAREAISRWHKEQNLTVEAVSKNQGTTLLDVEKQINVLLNMRLREQIGDTLFAAKSKDLHDQMNRLRRAADAVEEEFDRTRQSALNTLTFLVGARDKFLVGTTEEKREIARALGVTYVFRDGKMEIGEHSALPIYLRIENMNVGTESQQNTSLKLSYTSWCAMGDVDRNLYAWFKEKPFFNGASCLNCRQ